MSLGHSVFGCKYFYVSVVSKGQLCYAYTLGNYMDDDVLSNSGLSKLFLLFHYNVFIVLNACVKKVNSNAVENPVIGIAYNALDLFNQTPSLMFLEKYNHAMTVRTHIATTVYDQVLIHTSEWGENGE